MVGSVLMERMRAERDFDAIEPGLLHHLERGRRGPGDRQAGRRRSRTPTTSRSWRSTTSSSRCQGGDYTKAVYPEAARGGLERLLDRRGLGAAHGEGRGHHPRPGQPPGDRQGGRRRACKNFIGGNCTVSLMLMAIDGLLKADLVEWVSAMTYQAASRRRRAEHARAAAADGRGALRRARGMLDDPASAILDIDREVAGILRDESFPTEHFGVPLAGSLLPWIDTDLGNGQSREEWKGHVETNKILGRAEAKRDPGRRPVRARRRHALPQPGPHHQAAAATCPLAEIESILAQGNDVGARSSPTAATETLEAPHPGRGHRHARRAHRAPAQAADGRRSTFPPSPSATSCCGAPPSRCAACWASCSRPGCLQGRGVSTGGVGKNA